MTFLHIAKGKFAVSYADFILNGDGQAGAVCEASANNSLGLDAGLGVLAVAHHPQLLADLAAQDHLPVPHDDVSL